MCLPKSKDKTETNENEEFSDDIPTWGDYPPNDPNIIAYVVEHEAEEVYYFTSDEYYKEYVSK